MPGQATEIWADEFTQRFELLPGDAQSRIVSALRDLGRRLESFPHHRMQGMKCFRLRVGDYRVIYDFNRDLNTLHLITVGHRREIYR